MWSSDMVLQQQSEARFVGKATPGADVTIVAQWQKTPLTVKAGADGRWSAKIKTPEGGKKSYTLEFTDGADGESLTLENIVIGEANRIWKCPLPGGERSRTTKRKWPQPTPTRG